MSNSYRPKGRSGQMRPKKQAVTPEQLAIKPGDPVLYRNDFGVTEFATATSKPWQLGHGDWVVQLEGKSGGYDLSRVSPFPQAHGMNQHAEVHQ